MVLKLGDLEIYSYNSKDAEQRHLVYVLKEDVDFRKYVTKKLDERLSETSMGGGYNLTLPI